jgi:hypothetical protein
MAPGFAGGTATANELVAKATGATARPDDFTVSIVVVLADAKMSTGAPAMICSASALLPPKLKVTVTPGCDSSKTRPSAVNVPVSDEAAEIVSVVASVLDPHPVDTAESAITTAAHSAGGRRRDI